ncbi:MAG: hypothetical protein IJG52_04945 [Lachnospiraceae bacterium]|nr:hypothetical protein [Lachnospiraceae bacterium]
MSEFRQQLEARRAYLENLENRTVKKLERVPPGTLRISCSKGRIQYYHRTENKDKLGKYIPNASRKLAIRLAQKDYDERVLKAVRKELKAINGYLKNAPDSAVEQIYDQLNDRRKELVIPVIDTDEMFVEKWVNKPFRGKEFKKNEPELVTDRGLRVRSKSEMIIANILDKEGIPYRYEYPIHLKGYGMIHPDFMVLNVRLRKVFLWEHLGMMDDPEYAGRAIQRIAAYNQNRVYQGENLILTCETQNIPINVRQIRNLIAQFLK